MTVQRNRSVQFNFSSRLSARATTGGVLAVFSTMVLLMTLAGALGLWEFNIRQMGDLGTGFWVWGLVSWVVSVFVGAYLSSVSSRSVDPRDGVIHGAVVWAAACVLGCLFLSYTMLGTEHVMSRGMLLGAFLGDSLALGAAVLGGLLGSKSEVREGVSSAENPVAAQPFPARAAATV
jgi:uncharacterized BrkB/YihY/UPF0761 family membrane protein